jgi:hypothetical protein
MPLRRGEHEIAFRSKEGRERETPATAGGLQLICVGPVMPEPQECAYDEESLTAQVEARSLDAGEFAPAKPEVGPRIDEGAISAIDGVCQALATRL